MSFLSAIGSFFSSGKAVDNILDKDNGLLSQVGGWIGNSNFTEEERAELNKKTGDALADFVKSTLAENTERSKSRRDVSQMWIKTQLAMILITMMVAPLDMELAEFYMSIAFGSLMMGGTWAVIGFFFGPYMLGAHTKFGKKKD